MNRKVCGALILALLPTGWVADQADEVKTIGLGLEVFYEYGAKFGVEASFGKEIPEWDIKTFLGIDGESNGENIQLCGLFVLDLDGVGEEKFGGFAPADKMQKKVMSWRMLL
jgi:hypothetical protein